MRNSTSSYSVLACKAVILFLLCFPASESFAQFWKPSDLHMGWVNQYLKTNPKVGIAFHYGKAEYLGLLDPDGMNAMGVITFDAKDFEAIKEIILKARQPEELKNAKILDTQFDDVIQDSQRTGLVNFMKENNLDLLQIIDLRSVFTGIRDGKNGLSGNVVRLRYALYVESNFYFRQLLEDNSNKLSACRSQFDWLPMTEGNDASVVTEVKLDDLLNQPEAKQNVPALLSLQAFQSKQFVEVNKQYGTIGPESQANYEAIVLGMEGNDIKINKKKELFSALQIGGGSYCIMETVKGDNPATFWPEKDYEIIVARIKIKERKEAYTLCDVVAISKNLNRENITGLPVISTKDLSLGVGNETPEITTGMVLIGKKFTLEEFEKIKLAEEGIAAEDQHYYKSKDILHPKTVISNSAKPNEVPKKENKLLEKIQRFEGEGNKIAVVFTPGFMKLENPPEVESQSATSQPTNVSSQPSSNSNTKTYSFGSKPTETSAVSECKFEPGSLPFPDNYLSTGIEITKMLNEGFNTTIFEYVDEDVIPVTERKMLGQILKSLDFSDTQYKIAVMIDLEGKYDVRNIGKLTALMSINSTLKVVEFASDKQRVITNGMCSIPQISKEVSVCPKSTEDFETSLGPIESYYSEFAVARDKMLGDLIERQSKIK